MQLAVYINRKHLIFLNPITQFIMNKEASKYTLYSVGNIRVDKEYEYLIYKDDFLIVRTESPNVAYKIVLSFLELEVATHKNNLLKALF